MTDCFEVYKLVLDDESGRVVEWVEVKNIRDDAFFLGDNQSIYIYLFQLFTFRAAIPTPYTTLMTTSILNHTTPMA
jgi:hypothetical protein